MATGTIDRRRRRWRRTVMVAAAVVVIGALVAVVSALGYGPLARFVHGRGHPDPGGRRMAAIQALAPRTLPPGVSGVHVRMHGYRWDPRTCDGDAPGWASADVDQTFHASSDIPTILDQQMRQLNWRPQDETAQPSTAPQPALPPDGTRVYIPRGANPYGEVVALTPPTTFGAGLWDLDVSAEPAEHPSHDC